MGSVLQPSRLFRQVASASKVRMRLDLEAEKLSELAVRKLGPRLDPWSIMCYQDEIVRHNNSRHLHDHVKQPRKPFRAFTSSAAAFGTLGSRLSSSPVQRNNTLIT